MMPNASPDSILHLLSRELGVGPGGGLDDQQKLLAPEQASSAAPGACSRTLGLLKRSESFLLYAG